MWVMLWIMESQNHRKRSRSFRPTVQLFLSATSTCFLNTSRDSDSTTSLGSLCQHLTTLSEEKFFLISNLSLPWWLSPPQWKKVFLNKLMEHWFLSCHLAPLEVAWLHLICTFPLQKIHISDCELPMVGNFKHIIKLQPTSRFPLRAVSVSYYYFSAI